MLAEGRLESDILKTFKDEDAARSSFHEGVASVDLSLRNLHEFVDHFGCLQERFDQLLQNLFVLDVIDEEIGQDHRGEGVRFENVVVGIALVQ